MAGSHILSGTKFRRADAEGQLCSWLADPPRQLSVPLRVSDQMFAQGARCHWTGC